MAATTVNDFYKPRSDAAADEATLMRLSRQATIGWGVVQLAVALGAQFMDRSVLDAGLAVLSFASGAVLGAFLLGTLMPRCREPEALAGMIAGLATMTVVWAFTPLALTWYVFVGAVTTCGTAGMLSLVRAGARHDRHDPTPSCAGCSTSAVAGAGSRPGRSSRSDRRGAASPSRPPAV